MGTKRKTMKSKGSNRKGKKTMTRKHTKKYTKKHTTHKKMCGGRVVKPAEYYGKLSGAYTTTPLDSQGDVGNGLFTSPF